MFFQRVTQGTLWALPAMNMYAMKIGLGELSGRGPTLNSDVIHGLTFTDLGENVSRTGLGEALALKGVTGIHEGKI
ncbi:hypothetical protein OHR68_20170 [Spirillospora sp. NBC_00431]